MKINFVIPNINTRYYNIIMDFINPIIKWLNKDKFIISEDQREDCLNVIFFTEIEPKYKSVFISHGLADKLWRNYNSVKNFTFIFVSGTLWKEKYINQGFSADKIFINGYTKLDDIFSKPKITSNKILFAPTHSPNSPVSLYTKIEKYLKDYDNIIYSIHPANKENSLTTKNEYLKTKIVIADSGSTIYEAWSLGIPVIFCDWLILKNIYMCFPNSFEQYIYQNQLGYHAKNVEELHYFLHNLDKLVITEEVNKFIEKIFPTYLRGKSGKLTAFYLDQLSS